MRTEAARLCHALAEELRDTSAQVEQLAATLTMDEEWVTRFMVQLQNFDLIAQRIGESASLLDQLASGSSAKDAVDTVRLERMAERLRGAMSGGGGLAAAA